MKIITQIMTGSARHINSVVIIDSIRHLESIAILLILSFFLVSPAQAQEASLFISPGSESFITGDNFSIELKIDTGGVSINTAQATIYFPADNLEVLNISKDNSIFILWPEGPAFSNSSGKISFSGGLPHPGFAGIGNIITINFRAKNEGVVNLIFGKGLVLADDGKGTDILFFIKEAKYFIQKAAALPEMKPEVSPDRIPSPPQILSPTHSQEEEWYNNNSPRFQWELTSDITGVSFALDRNSDTIPDIRSEGKFQSKLYEDIDDGIWYFHLRVSNEIGWGPSSHRKIQVDVNPPRLFEIRVDNAGDPTNPRPNLYFETEDDLSGINYYRLKIGEGNFSDLMLAQINPFTMPFQRPGHRMITVRATDGAGNAVEARTIVGVEPIESPQITLWSGSYIAGEETLYLEGSSLPEVEVIIFLRIGTKEIKKWQTLSNRQGQWSFFTKELIKSGTYSLTAKVQDKRGVESGFSDSREIEVLLSGISFGPLIVAFRTLVLFLGLFLVLVIFAAGYFIYRIRRTRRILRKETREAKESLNQNFNILKKEIEKRIEMFDSKPGFSPEEKKVYEDLKEYLRAAEESINEEVKDIEKELE